MSDAFLSGSIVNKQLYWPHQTAEDSHMQRQNMAVLILVLLAIAAGVWLVDRMLTNRRIQIVSSQVAKIAFHLSFRIANRHP